MDPKFVTELEGFIPFTYELDNFIVLFKFESFLFV